MAGITVGHGRCHRHRRRDQRCGEGTPTLVISGGTVHVHSDGDGIDVNGSLTVTGGTTTVDGPTESMNGALDVDGTALVDGGTVTPLAAPVWRPPRRPTPVSPGCR